MRRNPTDGLTATYRVEDVEDIHFGRITSGVNVYLSRDTLFFYVMCDGMVEGQLSHSCMHGDPPHGIKVVIPKVCNDPELWARLAGREYVKPKPLDMSHEAIEKRTNRALKAAETRASNRESKIEALAKTINEEWPEGRLPSGEKLSKRFGVPKAVAKDARRLAIATSKGS